MKKLNYLLSAVVLLAVLVTVGCSKDDGPGITPEQAVTDRLSKSWDISSATLDNQDISDLTGLTLTINDALGYTTNSTSVARTPNPWPVGGSWAFVDEITDAADTSFSIRRDDEINIVVALTDTSLTLSFTFDDAIHKGSTGKEEALSGDWVFVFTAQ